MRGRTFCRYSAYPLQKVAEMTIVIYQVDYPDLQNPGCIVHYFEWWGQKSICTLLERTLSSGPASWSRLPTGVDIGGGGIIIIEGV